MTTGQTLIVVLAGAALFLYALVAVIDTIQETRREYEAKKGRLRLAALREQHEQDFDKDHPDRTRVGLTEEDR